MRLRDEDILRIKGINFSEDIETKIYKVPIHNKKQKLDVLECYVLKNIASESVLPDEESYNSLCIKFKSRFLLQLICFCHQEAPG